MPMDKQKEADAKGPELIAVGWRCRRVEEWRMESGGDGRDGADRVCLVLSCGQSRGNWLVQARGQREGERRCRGSDKRQGLIGPRSCRDEDHDDDDDDDDDDGEVDDDG